MYENDIFELLLVIHIITVIGCDVLNINITLSLRIRNIIIKF